jgi:hypothetical protein
MQKTGSLHVVMRHGPGKCSPKKLFAFQGASLRPGTMRNYARPEAGAPGFFLLPKRCRNAPSGRSNWALFILADMTVCGCQPRLDPTVLSRANGAVMVFGCANWPPPRLEDLQPRLKPIYFCTRKNFLEPDIGVVKVVVPALLLTVAVGDDQVVRFVEL